MNFPAADGRFISRRIDETFLFQFGNGFFIAESNQCAISFNAASINGHFDIAFRDGTDMVQLPPPLDVVVVSQALNIKAANTVAAREKRLIFIKPHYLQKVSRYYP